MSYITHIAALAGYIRLNIIIIDTTVCMCCVLLHLAILRMCVNFYFLSSSGCKMSSGVIMYFKYVMSLVTHLFAFLFLSGFWVLG